MMGLEMSTKNQFVKSISKFNTKAGPVHRNQTKVEGIRAGQVISGGRDTQGGQEKTPEMRGRVELSQ